MRARVLRDDRERRHRGTPWRHGLYRARPSYLHCDRGDRRRLCAAERPCYNCRVTRAAVATDAGVAISRERHPSW